MESTTLPNHEIVTMLQKAFTESVDACPNCGKFRWEYFGGRLHYGLRIEYWICSHCCLVAQSPKLRADYLSKFYSDFYRQLYTGSITPSDVELDFQRKRGNNLLSLFTEISGQTDLGNVLDFGCSAGGLLSEATEHFGAQSAIGVELDKEFGNLARQRGFLIHSTLDDVSGIFDLVTMSHVLEHIPDLVLVLSQISKRLRDGGFLCIEVPHSSGGACFEITHLWGFNELSLSVLLFKMGFRVIGMRCHGYPRNPEKANSYLVMIAKKQASSVEPKLVFSSSPTMERMKRYKDGHPATGIWSYQSLLLRNTVKQFLGLERNKLVAHSWIPSRLQSH